MNSNTDPRPSFELLLDVIADQLAATQEAELTNPTPCSDYDVAALQDHIVSVLKRITAIGNGLHFSTEVQQKLPNNWVEQWNAAIPKAVEAWADDAKLEAVYEVPWGTIPGFAAVFTYTGELATHAWDLSKATGRELETDHIDLSGALTAAQMIPAEGREHDDMPFDPPHETTPDAPTPEKVAAWLGRDPAWAGA